MGDIIYPGVVINRVNREITEADVFQYFLGQLKLDNTMVRYGGMRVKIFRKSGGTTRMVVSGINMPFDELRIACKTKLYLKNQIVQITNVDFGIERRSDGDMFFQSLSLNNHLKEGQGWREPINILTEGINQDFGNFGDLESTIYFDDVKQHVKEGMLDALGTWFYKGNIVARGTPVASFQRGRVDYANMEIVMRNRMEAFQAICFLNNNKRFSSGGKKFVTSNDGVFKCKLDMQCGLGKDGKILVIDDLVATLGYVPLNYLSDSIINKAAVHKLKTLCYRCSSSFEIVGIGADFSWLAGKCNCDLKERSFAWPNEEFVRMILPPSKTKIFSDEEAVKVGQSDKLIIFARGLLPLYDTPHEFRQIAYSAYLLEFRENKRKLHEQQAVGVMTEKYDVEMYQIRSTFIYTHVFRIKVPKTKLWCEDGMRHMRKATLIPLTNVKVDKETHFTYTEAKNNAWIKSTVREIAPSEDKDYSIVTVRANFSEVPGFEVGQYFKLFPKPPTTEKDAIRQTLSRWELRMNDAVKVYEPDTIWLHVGRVVAALDLEDNAKKIFVRFRGIDVFGVLDQLLLECYVGVQLELCIQDESGRIAVKKLTGRVTLYKTEENGNCIVGIVIVVPKSVTVLKNVKCSSQFWLITRSRFRVDDSMKKWVDLKIIDKSERKDFLILKTCEFRRIFDIKVDSSIGIGDIQSTSGILENWKERLQRDHSMMDYLLHASKLVDHNTKLNYMHDKAANKLPTVVSELRKNLNPSQERGIDSMLWSRVSALQGPPGTGKTTTLANGIGIVHHEDSGLILACCPSNYACDVLYEKVKKVNTEHQVGMQVVRMQSYSRQKKMVKGIVLEEADQNQLHVMVRRHPSWESDPEIKSLHCKAARFSGALLTRKEKMTVDYHLQLITSEILHSTDVVVCTVACASDGRLGISLVTDWTEREISALVVDEASLLTVPSCLPLLGFNPTRLWVVGDHCQLRPKVMNASAMQACLDVSWMEFLTLSPFIKKGTNFNMLNIQYRMASKIATVVSKYMYNNEVKSSSEVLSRNYENHPILKLFPELKVANIGCYSYDGHQEQKADPSYYNPKEVAITRDILVKLRDCNLDMSNVTIITMYASHKSYLAEMVTELGEDFEQVVVSTVDSSQGTESPVIILNTVRSNPIGQVGFLRDQHRMNVAMSRSIDYLLIVCDVHTLKSSTLPDILKLFNLLEEQQVDLNMKC